MFRSARIKLATIYLIIIMAVCVFFSVIIFSEVNHELNRFERFQKVRQQVERDRGNSGRSLEIFRRQSELERILLPPPPENDPNIILHARLRIILILVILNLFILGVAGVVGYMLAGITLRPIQQMIDEQYRFITDASHELRTPLTALRSEIQVSLRDKKLTATHARKLLQSNLEEVKHLEQLSESLIHFNQYQELTKAPVFQHVSLSSIVENAVTKMAPLAIKKKISLKNQVKEVMLEADADLLSELLVILLDNAIKYSQSHTSITLASTVTGQTVKITVSDEGVGIDEKDLPHVFERFYRADKSRTDSAVQGYGLGLAIAKQIVTAHHGQIEISDRSPHGTVVEISLPLFSSQRESSAFSQDSPLD